MCILMKYAIVMHSFKITNHAMILFTILLLTIVMYGLSEYHMILGIQTFSAFSRLNTT
jgi:hypothetical protein